MAEALTRRKRTPARRVLGPMVVLAGMLLLIAAGWIVPALLADTEATSSTPIRRELAGDHVIPLAAGQRACMTQVPLDRDSRVAQLLVHRVTGSGARLRVTADPGTPPAATGTVSLPSRLRPVHNPDVAVRLAPAPTASSVGELCVENAGPGGVELIGSADPRALTRVRATLDGTPLPQAFTLRLLDDRRRSALARIPDLVDRMAALSPLGPWAFWALIPLIALGVPLLVAAALALALRRPDDEPPAGQTAERAA